MRDLHDISIYLGDTWGKLKPKLIQLWEWWPGGEKPSPWTVWLPGGSATTYGKRSGNSTMTVDLIETAYYSASGAWQKIITDSLLRDSSDYQRKGEIFHSRSTCITKTLDS